MKVGGSGNPGAVDMVSVVGMLANDITACFSKSLSVRASMVLAPMLPVITEVVMHCADSPPPLLSPNVCHFKWLCLAEPTS